MGEMLAYCTPLSVRPGKRIRFHTSTTAAAYTLTVMRFSNGTFDLVESPLSRSFSLKGRHQPIPLNASAQGCGWRAGFAFTVPRTWASGIYAAKCEDEDGAVFYATFIVKPRRFRRAKLAVLANTNTWNSYNPWGGVSRYCAELVGDESVHLHLERPNPVAAPFALANVPWASACGGGHVDTDFQTSHLARAELWVLNWLAEAGCQVDVYTDLDMYAGIPGLRKYQALILTTHPEYWSLPMVDHLQAYLQRGGCLIYLGGNGIYELVDYDAGPNIMTVVGPYNANPRVRLFRNPIVGQPEAAVLGVAYVANVSPNGAPYLVTADGLAHRFFRGVALDQTLLIGTHGWNNAASGWEVDIPQVESPANLETLAIGQNAPESGAYMTYYDHPGGGWVFSAGSINFGGSLVVDCALQRIVRNALDDALGRRRRRAPRRVPRARPRLPRRGGRRR